MKKIKFADECEKCALCEEPFCIDCDMHYADCFCLGPHSEERMETAEDFEMIRNEIALLELCLNSAFMHLEEIQTLMEFAQHERDEEKQPKPENNPESD